MQESICLDCKRPLQIPSDLTVGDIIVCPQCKTELEVSNMEPPTVEWPHDGTYDDWDGDVEDNDDAEDDWLDDDDDEWLEDDDSAYSGMLAKQKRLQELDDLDRRRPPRPAPPRGNVPRSTPKRVDTRRRNDS